jgi:PPOX class probable F420-dependent enzyme
MATLSDAQVRALLDPPHFATLSTVNEDGTITSSLIWFNVEKDAVAINSAEGRRWPANVAAGRPLALLVYDPQDTSRFVEIRGTARQTDDADAHIDRLSERYLGRPYPFRKPDEVRVRFVVEPTAIRYRTP